MKDKKSGQTTGRNTQRAALIGQVADITGKSKRYVRLVLSGERNNETVFSTYMTLVEESSKLVDEVRRLVEIK